MKSNLNYAFIGIFIMLFFACNDTPSNTSTTNSTANAPIDIPFMKEGELSLMNNDSIIKQIDIELAKSDNKRAIGLMNRNSLGADQGMLFVFPQDNNTGFYMKDTRIALDIMFLGKDSTVISISKNRQPFDMRSEGPGEPYRYVLEVNAGKSDEWGIQEGLTKINWTETK